MSFGAQEPSDKFGYDDAETMIRRLEIATERSIQYFLRNMNDNGSIAKFDDLKEYGKLPNGLIMAGKIKEANRVIDFVLDRFYDSSTGDFVTRPGLKSIAAPFCIFYPYCNQWLIQAGLKLRRFDFVFKAAEFNDKFFNPKTGASTIIKPYDKNGNNINCIFNSAALGTTYLYLNKLNGARAIADMTVKMVNLQPDWNNKELGYPYYLRFDDNFKFIKYIEPEKGIRTIYKVQGDLIRQPYFSIGYPVGFMGLAYLTFGDAQYLETAEKLINYALRINKDVRSNQWSHKLMWGTSIIAKITNKQKYWDLVYDIANTIMNAQDPQTGLTSNIIDQAAEMAFWMPIIAMNIRQTKRKFGCVGDANKLSKTTKSKL